MPSCSGPGFGFTHDCKEFADNRLPAGRYEGYRGPARMFEAENRKVLLVCLSVLLVEEEILSQKHD